jgi:hypothetical protein
MFADAVAPPQNAAAAIGAIRHGERKPMARSSFSNPLTEELPATRELAESAAVRQCLRFSNPRSPTTDSRLPTTDY